MRVKPPKAVALTLPALALAATILVASDTRAQPPNLVLEPVFLGLETVVTGLSSPTVIAHAGDDRLFIAEREGVIRVVGDDTLDARPFLDIRGRVGAGGERGLLGLAFHPDYAANGFLFVNYTDNGFDTVISRFQVWPTDSGIALQGSERVLLNVSQPFANHNGGALAFGPEGYLYVALGDGGSGLDPQCNAQNPRNLLGSILRLDVDTGAGAPPYYSVPPDNPRVTAEGTPRPEVWADGLRNPWRISFDRATGDLYIGDVGQNTREEVNFEPAGGPGNRNYGWKVKEGTFCLGGTSGCSPRPPGCNASVYVDPVFEYGHSQGRCSITGGFVYRGSAIAALDGWYFYGDFCSGEILLSRRQESTPWVQLNTGLKVPQLTTFGEDVDGEIYATGLRGTLFRVTGPAPEPFDCVADDTTLCLGEGDRFQVRASFRVGAGPTRQARTGGITDDTGYFWFFREDNVEVVVKVLDGCPVNDRFWVFAGGLTNVETELFVTDSQTGRVKSYPNPPQTAFQPIQDTSAFQTCP